MLEIINHGIYFVKINQSEPRTRDLHLSTGDKLCRKRGNYRLFTVLCKVDAQVSKARCFSIESFMDGPKVYNAGCFTTASILDYSGFIRRDVSHHSWMTLDL